MRDLYIDHIKRNNSNINVNKVIWHFQLKAYENDIPFYKNLLLTKMLIEHFSDSDNKNKDIFKEEINPINYIILDANNIREYVNEKGERKKQDYIEKCNETFVKFKTEFEKLDEVQKKSCITNINDYIKVGFLTNPYIIKYMKTIQSIDYIESNKINNVSC